MLEQLVALIAPPVCQACRAPVPVGRALCGDCTAELRWLPRAAGFPWAPVVFDGPARRLVHALKLGGRPGVARIMAAHIAANAPPGLLAGALLVPAPAHPGRTRRRGFDHAAVLARRLGERTGLEVRDVLVRAPGSAQQVGQGRGARLSRDLGIGARESLEGRVVLVDDVCTTGATLAACARAALAAGAGSTAAVAYARVLG